jgi:hypothetical protein
MSLLSRASGRYYALYLIGTNTKLTNTILCRCSDRDIGCMGLHPLLIGGRLKRKAFSLTYHGPQARSWTVETSIGLELAVNSKYSDSAKCLQARVVLWQACPSALDLLVGECFALRGPHDLH